MPVAAVTYADALRARLSALRVDYLDMVRASAIQNIDPNTRDSDIIFIGAAKWGWKPSDSTLEGARMDLLGRVREIRPLVHLLFTHPTPELKTRHEDAFDRLEGWAERPSRDTSVPSTVEQALEEVNASFDDLDGSVATLARDIYAVRLVVDTNVLLDNPDLSVFVPVIGDRYRAHLFPVVLRELDTHKVNGRNPEIREAAKKADRRLKGLRDNGNVTTGVNVTGQVSVVFEHREPRSDDLPSWLDLENPDDRLVASILLLQSAHPGSAVYVATGDLNLQTKLAAVGLPHVELPYGDA